MAKINDELLKQRVLEYDGATSDYKSILYVCIKGGVSDILAASGVGAVVGSILGNVVGGGVAGGLGALSNDFGIMTAMDDCLNIYVVNKFSFDIKIKTKIVLPFSNINKIKVTKFLIWNTAKVYFTYNNSNYKIKIMISNSVLGIKLQKENLIKFLDFVRSKNLNN